jgi:WXG100 family type VII secretion target
MANFLQLKYSEINQIIKEMQTEQQQIADTLNKTKSMAEALVGKEWQGDAATKFQNEMNDLYLGKLLRVANALGAMADVAKKVSGHVNQADMSTKAFFKFD